jgi:5,10-methylenetetrahydromethanopterin reductase
MRFSLHGSVRNISEGVERARRAEEIGFDAIFLADSHLNSLDPFQVLAVSALRTQRIRLGTAVTNMVYRDPTLLAGSAVSLNEICDGRAILGIGTGDGPVYSLGRRATPIAQFEEGLKTIRALVQGKTIMVRPGSVGLRIGKLPVPIYVSAEGPKGLRVAGKMADGVILGNGFDLRVLRWARQQIAEGAQEAGRPLSDIELVAAGMICVAEDGEKARGLVRRRLANRAHHNFRFTLETVPPEELLGVERFMQAFDIIKPIEERVAPELVTDYLVHRFALAGTPEECIRRVQELEDAGVRHIMVTPPNLLYREMTEAWAREVMAAA